MLLLGPIKCRQRGIIMMKTTLRHMPVLLMLAQLQQS